MVSIRKCVYYALFFVLISTLVIAQDVLILNFEYDSGRIIFKEKTVKPGYFPDNKLAPAQGYRLIEISDKNDVLYSFNFEVPRTIFTDASTSYGEIKGNMIILNKTSFALIVPYFQNIKDIKILDSEQNEVGTIAMAPQLSPAQNSFLALILFFVGFVILVLSLWYYKKYKR